MEEFPVFALVEKMIEERGFGFVRKANSRTDFFFHLKGDIGPSHSIEGLREGDAILCQCGIDPRRPQQTGVLRWVRASDVPWMGGQAPTDQTSFDDIRTAWLQAVSLRALHAVLQARWHAQLWSDAARADLSDPVLRRVWLDGLAALEPEVLRENLQAGTLATYRFDFVAGLNLAAPECAAEVVIETFTTSQLLTLGAPPEGFLAKVGPDLRPKLAEWYALTIPPQATVRDVTTWAEGVPAAGLLERLFEQGRDLAPSVRGWALAMAEQGALSPAQVEAMSQDDHAAVRLFPRLSQARQAALLSAWRGTPEGLNPLLALHPSLAVKILWDGALAIDLETDGTRIWEIGCAQGTGVQRLHDEKTGTDLGLALKDLAEKVTAAEMLIGHNVLAWDWPILAPLLHLDRVPPIWDTLLMGYLLDPRAVSHALGGDHHAETDSEATLALCARQMARLPADLVTNIVLGRLAAPENMVRAVGQALAPTAGLSRTLPKLLKDLPSSCQLLLPEAELAIADWVPGIVVRPADAAERLPLPLWQIDPQRLPQQAGPLGQAVLSVAQRAAAEGIALRPSMLPAWIMTNPAAELIKRALVLPSAEGVRALGPLPSTGDVWSRLSAKTHRVALDDGPVVLLDRDLPALLPTEIDHSAALVRLTAGQWLYPDRAAGRLNREGGWRGLSVFAVDQAMVVPRPLPRPLNRPVLVTRPNLALYPGSPDQAGYWRGQLDILRTLVGESGQGVPVLLVVSSASTALFQSLQTALAEIGLAERHPDHRSRQEHLRRAADRKLCLVDGIESWPDWLALAGEAGVTLLPMVECLPAEEWYALSHTGAAEATETVKPATLLQVLPKLALRHLDPWLAATGLGLSPAPPVIFDTRSDLLARPLRSVVTLRPLATASGLYGANDPLAKTLTEFDVLREEAPTDLASMERFLIDHWKPAPGGNAVTGFKDSQRQAMEVIRAGASDVIVGLPTGEGKSVLFQVPALSKGLRNRRLTLVISPLKALMRDQVERLHEQGFAESVDFLNSDRPSHEKADVAQGVLDHRIVLLYVAPERLRSPSFVNLLARRVGADGGLEHVVFDETHCLNQWGYEFRPDYFHALKTLQALVRRGTTVPSPFLMLSATITASDRQSLVSLLANGAAPDGRLPTTCIPDGLTIANPLRSHIAVSPQHFGSCIYKSKEFDAALAERLPKIIEVIAKAKRVRQDTGQRSAVLIFVSWRAHAEDIARILAEKVSAEVDYYHAGLDAGAREDVYTRFRDGEIDVLVATKAFGMGMDIPDIHWAVHLAPPVYLEDYLQEVGRIGRGKNEREKAKLKKLDAILLFSDRDFETLRELRANSAVQEPDIKAIEGDVVAHSIFIEGRKVTIFPESGIRPNESATKRRQEATRVKMALFWLEKAEHLVQCGTVSDILKVEIRRDALMRISASDGVAGRVAKVIGEEFWPQDARSPAVDILAALADGIGLPLTRKLVGTNGGDRREAALNLSQIARKCGITTLDETMACIVDLQDLGGVTLTWQLDFTTRPLFEEPKNLRKALMGTISGAVARLLSLLASRDVVEFEPFEWLEEADWNLAPLDPAVAPKADFDTRETLLKRLRRAYLHGFRTLARASGIRTRQVLRHQGKSVCWQARLSRTEAASARKRGADLMDMLEDLLEIFARAATEKSKQVAVQDLIRAMQVSPARKGFSRHDLEDLMRLASATSMISAPPDLLPISYVLELNDVPLGLDASPEIQGELLAVAEMAEARAFAMEIFANLPEEAREAFVTGYFSQVGVAALRAFLDAELGNIAEEEDRGRSFVTGKREHLRATKVQEFFQRFEQSEEPEQLAAMTHPYDKHLLVNAGPGAGKTAVLVGRIVHLIRYQHVKPSEIVVLAFNRAVVFEIRARVREVFRSLGYAAYAGQVRISTFHGFAQRHVALDWGAEKVSRTTLLEDFAARLRGDFGFRAEVTGNCRCLLIDEFQDVDDAVYGIVRNLYVGSGGRAGVTVIGDDDQDILRWNRETGFRSGKPFSERFFRRFEEDFAGEDLTRLAPKVNFRSGRQIVERSQSMIVRFFEGMSSTKRLKTVTLKAQEGAGEGLCEAEDWRDRSWSETMDRVAETCQRLLSENPGTLAVLCRWNAEVVEMHRRLAEVIPGIALQKSQKLRIADLRHIGHWIDILTAAQGQDDPLLTPDLKAGLLKEHAIRAGCEAEGQAVDPGVLWDLCCDERSSPHLSDLIRFITALASDELQRLLGARRPEVQAVVSTIHKVKGLEYDNVIIVPSPSGFGDGLQGEALEMEAAEEARLFYVAMTRAKSRLVYFRGDRERAWGRKTALQSVAANTSVKVLEGDGEELFLSWALTKTSYNPDPAACQIYIAEEVQVGDPLILGGGGQGAGMGLFHDSPSGRRQIGYLSQKSGAGSRAVADLRVSAVTRFTPEDLPGQASRAISLKNSWAYVVLAEGRLR